MELIEHIERAWSWTGIKPEKVVGENDFGNLMVRDRQGQYWRICPEDLYCKPIAEDRAALDALIKDEEFQEDWGMVALVEEARGRLGPLVQVESTVSRFRAYSVASTAAAIWRLSRSSN